MTLEATSKEGAALSGLVREEEGYVFVGSMDLTANSLLKRSLVNNKELFDDDLLPGCDMRIEEVNTPIILMIKYMTR